MDAAISPGDSGGPVVDSAGSIVGLNEAQTGNSDLKYAVSSQSASEFVKAWEHHDPAALACGYTVPESKLVQSSHPDALILWRYLNRYLVGINRGDQPAGDMTSETGYEQAYGLLADPIKGSTGTFNDFRSQMAGQQILLDPLIQKGSMDTKTYGEDTFTAGWVSRHTDNSGQVDSCVLHTVGVTARDDRTGTWKFTKFRDSTRPYEPSQTTASATSSTSLPLPSAVSSSEAPASSSPPAPTDLPTSPSPSAPQTSVC